MSNTGSLKVTNSSAAFQYGLVNHALKSLVTKKYGQEAWEKIRLVNTVYLIIIR